MGEIKYIKKRDGRTVPFDGSKISTAIFKAAEVLGGSDKEMADYLAKQVALYLTEKCRNTLHEIVNGGFVPYVDTIRH